MVDLFAPIINPAANIRPVSIQPRDLGVEQAEKGINFIEKVQGLQEDDELQLRLNEIGQKAISGNQQAIDELALMPGGAKLAADLQQIASTRQESVIKGAQRKITDAAKFAASLLNEDENFVRMSLKREAFRAKENGDSEEGNELMRIAQLPNFAEIQSELRQDVALAAPADKLLKNSMGHLADVKKIREETRASVRKKVNELSKSIGGIETNFNKITNLSEEIKKGNRTAVAQGLIALVKLGDPNSAVLSAEMEAALNQPNPLAAMKNILEEGAGSENVRALAAKIDPLDPKNVSVEELLATGRALVSSQLPTLENQFNTAFRESSFLTPEGRGAIFSSDVEGRIASLGQIIQQSATDEEQNPTGVQSSEASVSEVTVGGIPIAQITTEEQLSGVSEEDFRALSKAQQRQIIDQIRGASQ